MIVNSRNQVLLGLRKNRPAEGFWFVPGGRILKNESLKDAFERLTISELGHKFALNQAKLQGPYDHFYHDSIFGEYPSTHYVAIAYRLEVDDFQFLPDQQHSAYKWFDINDLILDKHVHQNTKNYFSFKG